MNKIYTTKEAAAILSIKLRAVQTRCANERILRRSNKYVITDEIIQRWKQTYYEDSNATKRNVNATEGKLHMDLNQFEHRIEIMEQQIQKLYESNQSLNKVIRMMIESKDE